jgi:uncharacterized protein
MVINHNQKIMKKTVLITGASGGIGLAFAEVFVREGYNLVLIARSEDKLIAAKNKLEAQHPIVVEVIATDLTQPSAPLEIFNTIMAKNKHIDILVNNAGVGDFGNFSDADWDKQHRMVQLNILAMMQMTKLFMKPMQEAGYGKILNLASVAAFQPGPLMSVYYATKAFTLSFSEALFRELKGSGVTVTALCPGPTETGFVDAASMANSKLFRSLKVAKVEDVAAYGYRALMKGWAVVVHGFLNNLLVFSVRLMPRFMVREIVVGVQGSINKN